MTVRFNNLAPGSYVASVQHDEDGNGKLKTNFIGMPKEGIGLSNNPGGIPALGTVAVPVRRQWGDCDHDAVYLSRTTQLLSLKGRGYEDLATCRLVVVGEGTSAPSPWRFAPVPLPLREMDQVCHSRAAARARPAAPPRR